MPEQAGAAPSYTTSRDTTISDRRQASAVDATAGMRIMFPGDGTPPTDLVGIEITNCGVRQIEVSTVGWRTGWLWQVRLFGTNLRLEAPECLKYRFAIQNPDVMLNPPQTPWLLDPGRKLGFYTTVSSMQNAPGNESRQRLFGRKLGRVPGGGVAGGGPRLFRHWFEPVMFRAQPRA